MKFGEIYRRLKRTINAPFSALGNVIEDAQRTVDEAQLTVLNEKRAQIGAELAEENRTFDYNYAMVAAYFAGEMVRYDIRDDALLDFNFYHQNIGGKQESTLPEAIWQFQDELRTKGDLTATDVRQLCTLHYFHALRRLFPHSN